MIRFDSVSKHYPDGTVAVDSLDMQAPSGQITVLVGPSGCGKTTSLRMINRMIEPTSGSIWLDDKDTSTIPAHELRRQIGYVIQHAGLFPHRTIVDNVATVPYLLGWDRKKARARAHELLERVGLPAHFADRYPAQLSGGQQQRVGVARALAADPPVMLMDEPFSAVDPVVRDQLQEEFLRLQGELGKTIVFVTHDIDEAIKLGDQVAVLGVGGKLAQLATPAELLNRPVNAFVAGFVGRDRGYRALGFAQAHDLPTRDEQTIRLNSAITGTDNPDGWLLAVDDANAPQGWLRLDELSAGQQVTEELLHRGGTVAAADGSLRAALDACLSSPTGRGVIVDTDGALLGTVTASEVLELIQARPPVGQASAG
ncbi:MAG: ABC transporter ATP-binding protein [Actinomycetota bacterium]|nr:ABC transporter ATP-binding protein [Actinomycetota bacterium]MDQ2958367.1 ABC transporter ATP-binding protein [Actinomycetota bacterium]